MDDARRQRRGLAIGIDMGHDIVADLPLPLPGGVVDVYKRQDHCSNIAGCVAGLPDGNQGLHAAQTALRQQDPAFEDLSLIHI